ncbi:MAG: TonB-dependent receptor, partial [Pseudomonadota bacterium]|nr:TonB-dependent receptor [Pseudomonadota bacterium]
ETSFRIGTADGHSQEFLASQLLGKRWAGGHMMIAYEFYKRERWRAADRNYATDDLRAFGGPDNRIDYASPGTIYAGDDSFAIPRGQNGIGLTGARLNAGTVNLGDSQTGTDLLPDQRRHSIFAAISQDVAQNVRVYARGLASFRSFDQAIRSDSNDSWTVPLTNPFYVDPIGTHRPVDVQYNFDRDLGNQRDRGTVKAYGGTGGLEGKIGKWTLDAHGTWGEQDERYLQLNLVNSARLNVALADTNPVNAYNLFGDGPSTNPATIAKIRGSTISAYHGIVWSLTARADGPLFALPGGEVKVAFGGEYREDRYRELSGTSDVSTLSPTVSNPTPLLPLRTVRAFYGEVLVPVFGGDATLPGFKRLEFSAAVRTERYSDFGATTNPKFGASWDPFSGLTIRGSFGKSFRAPLDQELRQDPGSMAIFAFRVPDPRSGTGQSNIIVIRGNDPNLRPERSTSWSLGADFKPLWLSGLRASVTYFNVDYRDRIATPASQLFSVLTNRATFAPIIADNPSPARVAELFASPIYRNFLGIPSTATFVAVVDARTQNLSVVKQTGLDFDLAYAFDAGGGRAEIGGVATHIFHIDQGLPATAPTINVVNSTGNPVDLRMRGHATWNSRSISVAVFLNYVGGYANKTVSPFAPVASWTTVDFNLAYRFKQEIGALKGLKVSLNATNVFDRAPPYVDYETGATTSGYDAENANPLGRVITLQLTKSW